MNFQNPKTLKKLQAMEKTIAKKTAAFEAEQYEFTYQKNITIQLKGDLTITSLQINKDLLDPEDPGMLQDMLVEAFNEAISSIQEEKESMIEQAWQNMR